ncbi:MAG: polyphosphate:AMP phosphotransferase [Gammaproteobacteria bacterium]
MFEAAEVGHRIEKKAFEAALPALRVSLLEAQWAVQSKRAFPVLVVIAGVDGAGKGETVNVLNEWMDPRHIRTVAFDTPTEEEAQRPRMWRYWQALPARGQIGILFGSWYMDPIVARVYRRAKKVELALEIERINRFERMLADDGALILKFWFHLSKDAQRARLEKIDRDPRRTWRVTRADWKQFEHYDRYYAVSEHVLRETSTGYAPWQVVEGADEHYRHLTVGTLLRDAIDKRLAATRRHRRPPAASSTAPLVAPLDALTVLGRLDLTRTLSERKYERELEQWQGELARLSRGKGFEKRAIVVAFEGMDAAGKGGAIRRLTGALDARQYRVVPVGAPNEEERAYPYLWRFWRHLPRRGRMTIYDRSWYGRVLVERIEGYCTEADWMRAYGEINEFEEELVDGGGLICKFWLHISPEEQLRRFEERTQTGFKHHKITSEDWRNRARWPLYQQAAADMIERTSTRLAPWTLVEAEDKHWARIKVLKTLVEHLREAL